MTELDLKVGINLTFSPYLKENRKIHITLQDTSVRVVKKKEGGEEQIGEIIGCLGGAIEIRDKLRDETWTLKPLDLWEAYTKAREAND